MKPTRLLRPWDFPSKCTGVGWYFLLQGIYVTQGLNLGLPHCRQMLCHLSHLLLILYREGEKKSLTLVVVSFCWLREKEKSLILAAYFLRLGTPRLPACDPLVPPVAFRSSVLPGERGVVLLLSLLLLIRGVVPKLVRQHILLRPSCLLPSQIPVFCARWADWMSAHQRPRLPRVHRCT